ncbi:hypothetical protein BDP27DRAFT_1424449 [Rhodocollybia butyracea]|uniref:Uncharacterized protein n=1 Tax=Rhodocollybia butyracea TaxID=206335 RepID=A0A9P5PM95_9AGAR|nr:hypothetical protein BDP27DRAFT_1424449 [Rhodocollybia butyracea]
MIPDERQLVSAFAEEGFFNVFILILIFTGYGAFILGLIIALQSLTIGSWGRPQTFLLVCLITTFICFSWNIVNVGAGFLGVDRFAFMHISDELGITTQIANKKVITWQDDSNIQLLLSDSVVVWRVWALYHQSKFWRSVLAILMIANISLNVADSVWVDVKEGINLSESAILDWLSTVASLIVNMVGTILFSYKAWKHYRCMKGLNGGLAHRGRRAQKVLNLLIESGVIFCTLQSMYIIVIALCTYNIILTSTSQLPRHAADAIFVTASASYPAAVIGLLHKDNKQLARTKSTNALSSIHSDDTICLTTMEDSGGNPGIVASLQ